MSKARKLPVSVAALAAFGIGLGFGHLTVTPSRSGVASIKQSSPGPPRQGDDRLGETTDTPLRAARVREKKLPLTIDAEGNYVLPPAMADRLDCVVLTEMKVNAADLRILGLDDSQIDRTQELVDEAFRRFFERKKAAMSGFTISDDEMVWLIPGDKAGAQADEQRIIDGVRAICGAKAGLLSNRLVQQIKGSTAGLGEEDYFLRIYKPTGDGTRLAFENLSISPGPNGEPQPKPGDSFMDYQKRWTYSSSGRYGGTAPPDTLMPLIGDKDWQRLLTPKR
ncbi:hypothetical protein JIN84_00410 [Luteolibacter yonseiensis]|uniref:Uncharacterized protein n=1 Tax=Luteolibacter yonseiensis TaxID=1144680 RepID=A0A934R2H8_9BACT|nr:hypothetical protein [Luteolibacter yonseiensis]MBK1814069.1 hypothetical protein [Luteolibacter yonseiensis]